MMEYERIIELSDRVKAGGELTPEEQEEIRATIEEMMVMLQPLIKAVREAFEALAKACKELWDSLSPETRTWLEKEFPLKDRSPITAEISPNLSSIPYGIPITMTPPPHISQQIADMQSSIMRQEWLR